MIDAPVFDLLRLVRSELIEGKKEVNPLPLKERSERLTFLPVCVLVESSQVVRLHPEKARIQTVNLKVFDVD